MDEEPEHENKAETPLDLTRPSKLASLISGGQGSAVVIDSETVIPKKFNKEVNEYL